MALIQIADSMLQRERERLLFIQLLHTIGTGVVVLVGHRIPAPEEHRPEAEVFGVRKEELKMGVLTETRQTI